MIKTSTIPGENEMQVGKKYKRTDINPNIGCTCVFIDRDWALLHWDNGPKSYWLNETIKQHLVEVTPEQWVSLWWTDKHKTNVSISSAFYDSEAEADGIGKFTASGLFIKSVRVS